MLAAMALAAPARWRLGLVVRVAPVLQAVPEAHAASPADGAGVDAASASRAQWMLERHEQIAGAGSVGDGGQHLAGPESRERCSTIAIPGRVSSKSSRPSPSATSATWRSPIRRASPPPARRSRPIPAEAANLTSRQNLVAVISNGTAVLGLGDIGPLASKPVMEGKAVLFKKFAGIDVFDIEVAEKNVGQARRRDRRPRADLRRHQPRGHQGARMLRGRGAPQGPHGHPGLPRRPARHGDHRRRGGHERPRARGQAHRATSRSSPRAPAPRRSPASTSWCPSAPGARTSGSPTSRASSTRAARRSWTAGSRSTRRRPRPRTLAEVIPDADVFLGLSAGGVLKPEFLARMAPRPLILALANPVPGDHAGGGRGGAARRDDLHRALGLPEPGQQRPVLPLHLPRRARRRRDDHQRGDEGRGRQGDRGARPRGALRGRRPRLWRRGACPSAASR